VNGARRGVREVWDGSEAQLRKQWPVWVLALGVYALAGVMLVTRVRIPSPLHLIVFIMAAGVLSVTSLRIEWGVLALALMMPFARPGITIGTPKVFQISGFNFALVGVAMAYTLRYAVDAQFASLGPILRRTRIDGTIFCFGFLVLLSGLWSFNINTDAYTHLRTLLFLKEQILYFLWFYLLVAILREPKDLRQFAVFFAIGGLIASLTGMATRLAGGQAAITAGTMGQNLEEGAGGRMEGGWLGLSHPNMFAALLLMTIPIWFFAVSHLKHGIRRIVAEVAVINGLLGLLFTYSRSAWLGSVFGLGLVGLADRRALSRIILFVLIFAVAAQTIVMFTIDMNLTEVVINRIEQLEESTFSSRPYIYRSAMTVIRAHPLLGVGLGAFSAHAPATPMGWRPTHSHNVYLAYAAEAGLPAAFFFALFVLRLIVMSVQNLRNVGRVPGYGFIALGSCGALAGITVQTMAVQVFHQRILGFVFYALAAVVVAMHRMHQEGKFDDLATSGVDAQSRVWVA